MNLVFCGERVEAAAGGHARGALVRLRSNEAFCRPAFSEDAECVSRSWPDVFSEDRRESSVSERAFRRVEVDVSGLRLWLDVVLAWAGSIGASWSGEAQEHALSVLRSTECDLWLLITESGCRKVNNRLRTSRLTSFGLIFCVSSSVLFLAHHFTFQVADVSVQSSCRSARKRSASARALARASVLSTLTIIHAHIVLSDGWVVRFSPS